MERRIYKPGQHWKLEEVRSPQSLQRERGPANTPTSEPSHPLLSHSRTHIRISQAVQGLAVCLPTQRTRV